MSSNPKFTLQGMYPLVSRHFWVDDFPFPQVGYVFSFPRWGSPPVWQQDPRCRTCSVHWQSLTSTKRRRLSWRWPGGLVGWLVGWLRLGRGSRWVGCWRLQGNHHHHNHPSCHGLGEFLGRATKHLWSLSNFRWEDPRFAKMTQNHLKSKMTRRIEYIEWIYKTDFFINFLNSWIFLAQRVQGLNPGPPRKMVRFRQGKKPRDDRAPKNGRSCSLSHGSGWVKWYYFFNTQMLLVWNIYLYLPWF